MAKIDTTLIEGFEDLSAEEKISRLLELDIPDDNGEQLSKLKKAVEKATKEASEYKKQLRKTEDESKKTTEEGSQRIQDLEEQLNKLMTDKQIADATSKFIAMGMDSELADKAAKAYVSKDGDIFDTLNSFKKSILESQKKELLKTTPEPDQTGTGKQKKMTKEEFRALSLVEKQKLATENAEEYNRLVAE